MENRLVMNEKLVATGRLAANIAHEINNPLFAIANSIAVIKGQLKNAGGDVGEVLPLAEKEIARVRKITQQAAGPRQGEPGDLQGERHRRDPGHGLRRAEAEPADRQHRHRPRPPETGAADPLQPGQPAAGVHEPDPERQRGHGRRRGRSPSPWSAGGDAYAIHFRDQGPGFADAIRKKIFEPFNSSKDAKGAGLGLYISYHIIKRHGGSHDPGRNGVPGRMAHLVVTLPRRGGAEHA